MYRNKKIAVVVPMYNEEKLISRVIETMPDFVDRIIIVDDGSIDNCYHVVESLVQKGFRKIVLMKNDRNEGVGGAIIHGYERAFEEHMDIAVVMAGDAQMDPSELPKLLDPVVEGKADYTKGNRLFTGEAWKIIPKHRYLGNSVLSLLTKIASGYWHVADSQSGYTALKVEKIPFLKFYNLYRKYGMPNDMLIHLNVANCRVMDVPVRPIYNIGEKSGIRLSSVIPAISWMLVKGFFWRMKEKYIIRDFHPLIFFYLLGIATFPTGFIFGLFLLWARLAGGHVAATSALFAVFLFITGLQSLFFAMWMDMENNRNLVSQT